jgi:hypothetical protein
LKRKQTVAAFVPFLEIVMSGIEILVVTIAIYASTVISMAVVSNLKAFWALLFEEGETNHDIEGGIVLVLPKMVWATIKMVGGVLAAVLGGVLAVGVKILAVIAWPFVAMWNWAKARAKARAEARAKAQAEEDALRRAPLEMLALVRRITEASEEGVDLGKSALGRSNADADEEKVMAAFFGDYDEKIEEVEDIVQDASEVVSATSRASSWRDEVAYDGLNVRKAADALRQLKSDDEEAAIEVGLHEAINKKRKGVLRALA